MLGEAGIDVERVTQGVVFTGSLVRELFDSSKGFFTEDEDSKYCWFNMSTQKPIKFYRLTGIVLGLALYNSTILDISFPPVLFKRLLGEKYNLKDFSILRPMVGASLKKLLGLQEIPTLKMYLGYHFLSLKLTTLGSLLMWNWFQTVSTLLSLVLTGVVTQ